MIPSSLPNPVYPMPWETGKRRFSQFIVSKHASLEFVMSVSRLALSIFLHQNPLEYMSQQMSELGRCRHLLVDVGIPTSTSKCRHLPSLDNVQKSSAEINPNSTTKQSAYILTTFIYQKVQQIHYIQQLYIINVYSNVLLKNI